MAWAEGEGKLLSQLAVALLVALRLPVRVAVAVDVAVAVAAAVPVAVLEGDAVPLPPLDWEAVAVADAVAEIEMRPRERMYNPAPTLLARVQPPLSPKNVAVCVSVWQGKACPASKKCTVIGELERSVLKYKSDKPADCEPCRQVAWGNGRGNSGQGLSLQSDSEWRVTPKYTSGAKYELVADAVPVAVGVAVRTADCVAAREDAAEMVAVAVAVPVRVAVAVWLWVVVGDDDGVPLANADAVKDCVMVEELVPDAVADAVNDAAPPNFKYGLAPLLYPIPAKRHDPAARFSQSPNTAPVAQVESSPTRSAYGPPLVDSDLK